MSRFFDAFDALSRQQKNGWLWEDAYLPEEFDDIEVECIEQFGGSGKGDDIWAVYKVSEPGEPDRLFKVEGWYSSSEGSEYDSIGSRTSSSNSYQISEQAIMNDFEKFISRYGGRISDSLMNGEDWKSCLQYANPEIKKAGPKIAAKCVDKHEDERREEQGNEGEVYAIYSYVDGKETKFYRIDGVFDSYGENTEYLGFYEVEGEEVTVTKFKPKS